MEERNTWAARLIKWITCRDLDWPDEETGRRVQVLRLGGLALAIFGGLFMLQFVILGDSWVGLLMTGLWVVLIVLWILARRGRRLILLAHMMLACMWGAVVASSWFTGGLGLANDATLFTITPYAVFLAGPSGMFWALASLGALLGMHALEVSGYVFPQLLPDGQVSSDMLMTWLVSMVVVIAVSYLYEATRLLFSRRLEEARARAEAASLAKGRFLAKMSHEFRTPLNTIIGSTDVLLEGEDPEEQGQKLESVKASAFALLGLVEEVLEFSAIEAGRLAVQARPFQAEELGAELVEGLRPRAEAKGLELKCHCPSLPGRLVADPRRLRQILLNLLDNAIKYTDTGWVELGLEHGDGPEGPRLLAWVADSGPGIAPGDQDIIFEAFGQGGRAIVNPEQGTGLGLAISAELAQAMGGQLHLESQPGQGSRFTLRLPWRGAPKDVGPGRILAAEDDPVGRELLGAILARSGLEVDLAADGEEALRLFDPERHGLVLMDLRMPIMDGLEATARIRAKEDGQARVPILALTAHALDEERQRCLAAGMDGFITKPIEAAKLLECLDAWLRDGDESHGNRPISSV